MNKPLVTVIIPAYNSEKYIGRCIESVLNQTMKNFELLVIDDGSKDDTGKIVCEYKDRDKRIRYYRQDNMGIARTRNKAIKLAKGDFIAFMDNDDYIDKDYLDVLLPRKGEDIVISGFKRPDKNGKIVKKMRLSNEMWSKFMNPTPWAKIYRRSFIIDNKLFFLDNNIGEDIYFNLIAMLQARKVKILSYVGYNWYYNTESVSSTMHRNFHDVDVLRLLESCYDEIARRGLLEKNRDLVEFFFFRFVVWFLLYSCKGQKKADINDIYERLFNWFLERFPNFLKNKYLKHGALPGEERMTRMAYKCFLEFYKRGLGSLFIWIYAKL